MRMYLTPGELIVSAPALRQHESEFRAAIRAALRAAGDEP